MSPISGSAFRGIVFFSFFLLVSSFLAAEAATTYHVDTKQSSIRGSIHYSVIGKYEAVFKEYAGTIVFDPQDTASSSVHFKIKVKSLRSTHPRLDRIVCSEQLLNTDQYPDAVFTSQSIRKKGNSFEVTGTLELRGVKKQITFPFSLEGPLKDSKGHLWVEAHGRWAIRRKDFGVNWNKILDQGGIVVGDHVTIDWKLIAAAR